jgi:hypothetical protein
MRPFIPASRVNFHRLQGCQNHFRHRLSPHAAKLIGKASAWGPYFLHAGFCVDPVFQNNKLVDWSRVRTINNADSLKVGRSELLNIPATLQGETQTWPERARRATVRLKSIRSRSVCPQRTSGHHHESTSLRHGTFRHYPTISQFDSNVLSRSV